MFGLNTKTQTLHGEELAVFKKWGTKMRKLLGLAVAIGTLQGVSIADHAQLSGLALELTRDSRALYSGARRVVGWYPTWRQRYALEHISFLSNSAHRLQYTIQQGRAINDHAHDEAIHRAYRRVEHDTRHARETFGDLFRRYSTNDHSADYVYLDRLLSNCERLTFNQIPQFLP